MGPVVFSARKVLQTGFSCRLLQMESTGGQPPLVREPQAAIVSIAQCSLFAAGRVPAAVSTLCSRRFLPSALLAWHRLTQTGLAPGRKRTSLPPARCRAVQNWPLEAETGCVVLTTVCRVGARKSRTSSTVVMPMLRRRHCGSKCTRPRATLVKY